MSIVLPTFVVEDSNSEIDSIDDDILNLMDEVNLDEFLKEVTEALDDPEKFTQYVREKTTVAVERFLVSWTFVGYKLPFLILFLFARITCPRCQYQSRNEI